jgi:AcrR family transcriptional regulator
MTSPTRWAGVPLVDRRAERRTLLIAAAFTLFGAGGEPAVSVRSVCRECGLNTRYFYESFADVNQLLGATYDDTVLGLGEAVEAAVTATDGTQRAKTRAGMAAVLGYSSGDPRRGRMLFTDAPANAVLAKRRHATQEVLFQLVIDEDERLHPGGDPLSARVGAALYTGAMTELVQQWLSGRLGDDVNAVVDHALARVLGPQRPGER